MAITRPFAASSQGGVTAAASFTVTEPGTILANDVIFVWACTRVDRTITTPTGWNLVTGDPTTLGTGTAGIAIYTFWRRGAPTHWQFNLSASHAGWCWGSDVYRGVRTTGDPFEATATKTENASATVEVPTLTGLSRTDDVAIAVAAFADTVAPLPTDWGVTPATGFSQIVEVFTGAGSYSLMVAFDELAANSVAESTWTLNQQPQNTAARMLALTPSDAVAARPRMGWGVVA